MSRACKCHGVSGSCSVRVCWRRLPPLREVGSNLGLRYDGASHVKLAIGNGRKRKRKLKPIKLDMKKPSKTDLVYLEDSPDYCERNERLVNWYKIYIHYIISLFNARTKAIFYVILLKYFNNILKYFNNSSDALIILLIYS